MPRKMRAMKAVGLVAVASFIVLSTGLQALYFTGLDPANAGVIRGYTYVMGAMAVPIYAWAVVEVYHGIVEYRYQDRDPLVERI